MSIGNVVEALKPCATGLSKVNKPLENLDKELELIQN